MPAQLGISDRRRYGRAQVHLPVRLRWLGPFRSEIEITRTLDAGRDGFRFRRDEICTPGSRVWTTLPFHAETAEPLPEIPSRIIWVRQSLTGGFEVAVRFDEAAPQVSAFTGPDRRSSRRVALAMPLRVLCEDAPWPEDTITLDVAESSLAFVSARVHHAGDAVRLEMSWGRWMRHGPVPGRIERIAGMSGSSYFIVAVSLSPAPQFSNPRFASARRVR
ncbi:MAG: hypothetical protein ACRD50_07805 [Candidatus Acidiferrales bacterium]